MQLKKWMIGLSVGFSCVLLVSMSRDAQTQVKEVEVALIAPLSGPWARAGEQMRQGAELAIEDINKAGGIKALNGARMRLLVADAGDTSEKARTAAQRLLAQYPDLMGGTGAWLSSFTLAITEVTERAGLPWLTISFSDQITQRGYKYVFQTPATAAQQAQIAIPTIVAMATKATGTAPRTIGVIVENAPSPLSFLKPMREGGFEAANLKLVMDEMYTPPLSDATSIVQKVRASRPDLLLLLCTSVADNKLIIEKLNEFGLGKQRMALIGYGNQYASPELLNALGGDLIDGLMVLSAGWPTKEHADLVARYKAKYKEPWMTQDTIYTYGDMWLLKEAAEMAKSGDREKVTAALHSMDTTTGAARYYSGGRIKFDDKGHRVGASLLILQWQNGVPVLIFPGDVAAAPVKWPRN
jgi:branched-chain amino acid transport system substrate-binding protein